MPTGVMTLIVDAGVTSGGNPSSGSWNRSARYVEFDDVQDIRWVMASEVTNPLGTGAWVQNQIFYSTDSTDGVTGTWTALLPALKLTGDDYDLLITPWQAIPVGAKTPAWLRMFYTLSAAGVSSNTWIAELHYR